MPFQHHILSLISSMNSIHPLVSIILLHRINFNHTTHAHLYTTPNIPNIQRYIVSIFAFKCFFIKSLFVLNGNWWWVRNEIHSKTVELCYVLCFALPENWDFAWKLIWSFAIKIIWHINESKYDFWVYERFKMECVKASAAKWCTLSGFFCWQCVMRAHKYPHWFHTTIKSYS